MLSDACAVTTIYLTLLGRAPEPAAVDYWTHNHYTTEIVEHVWHSDEFAAVGGWSFIYAYVYSLGRDPDPAGLEYWYPRNDDVEAVQDWVRMAEHGCPPPLEPPEADEPAGEAGIVDAIHATFPEDPHTAVKIARCESSLKLDAVGPDGGDRGLFQVRWPVHHRMLTANGITEADLFTLDGNLAAARLVFDDAAAWHPRGPWGPWVCLGKIR